MYSDEEDLSECEERCDDKLLSQGDRGPKLSKEEIRLKNTYTYDDEPVKAWRQYSDYTVLKECNEYTWYKVQQILGKYSGFSSSLDLYKNRSNLISLIEIIICNNRCYYLPGKCVLKHGHDLKYLMRKSLHDKYGPQFTNLFNKKVDGIKIEVERNGRPKLWELAEKIAFNTPLEYDEDGYLKVDYIVLQEKYWKNNRPCFIKEENKVLNIIHGLLLSSSEKREEEIDDANRIYSQNLPGLNEPILKSMCFGPDNAFEPVGQEVVDCDIQQDEHYMRTLNFNVKHGKCSDLQKHKHWKYQHGEDMPDISHCIRNKDLSLEGPICDKDSRIVYYPCNLKHCWICCVCTFCRQAKLVHCKDHADHIRFNIKDCVIQENAQCQEHWINHVENFEDSEDIKVDLKLLFHKDKLIINGRNYTWKTIKYAGLKLVCKKCRRNTNDHLNNHLTPHMQCKHCSYEMKTLTELNFWGSVCNICGKVFDSRSARNLHSRRYNVPEQVCEICEMRFSSKYNLSRHMTEQHDAMHTVGLIKDDGNQEDPHKCHRCDKSFKYQRNLKLHIADVHDKKENIQCKLCNEEMNSKSLLKRHLEEQHKVFDLENPIQNKDPSEFVCNLCSKGFKRNEHLASHMNSHKFKKDKYTCSDCGKQFTTKSNLNHHQVSHTDNKEKYVCDLCQKTFSSKGNLGRHKEGVHNRTAHICDICDKEFSRQDTLKDHEKHEHK